MSFYRHLLSRHSHPTPSFHLLLPPISSSRLLSFSSIEEVAAERRRRKRQLRIEPPTRRDPSNSQTRPSRPPNSPRLPDSTSSLVGPRLSLHNRIQTLIRSNDLDSASSQTRQSLFSPLKPTVFTCNAVISSLLHSRRYNDVTALFHLFFSQHNIIPNIVSYNLLITSHCSSNQVDKALDIYRQILLTAPFTPSVYTYRYLTKGLVDSNRIPDAVNLLREMICRGHPTDSLVYNNLIAGYIALDDMENAVKFFDELREHCPVYDGVVHATVMEGYWKFGLDKQAMDCYHSLLDRRFRMHPATGNVLLETLLKHGKNWDAQNLFDLMLDEHKPPVYTGVNAETYNIMIRHCCREGRFDEAVEVFHSTGVKPLAKDLGQYKFIIEKLCGCDNGHVDDAVKLFDEMLSQYSLEPDAATYSFFADAYLRNDGIEDAVVFLYKVLSGGEAAVKNAGEFCQRILDRLAGSGSAGRAVEVFGKMKEGGVTPNAAGYEVLIAGLCREGKLDGVQALFEEMMKCGFVAGVELQSLISESFRNAGREQETEFIYASSSSSTQAESIQADSGQCVAGDVVPSQTTSGQQVTGGVFGPLPDLQETS